MEANDMEQTTKTEPETEASNEKLPPVEEPKTTNKTLLTQEIMDLIKRAEEGDLSVMPQLSDFLDKRPDLWRKFGDLGKNVEDLLVAIVSGTSLFANEAVRRRLEELRAELAGPAPSPLEKLIVDRVCIGWLQTHAADISAANQPQSETTRRQNAAQRFLLGPDERRRHGRPVLGWLLKHFLCLWPHPDAHAVAEGRAIIAPVRPRHRSPRNRLA
jgi:hypothetical protein